jgi:hypothetical protein
MQAPERPHNYFLYRALGEDDDAMVTSSQSVCITSILVEFIHLVSLFCNAVDE